MGIQSRLALARLIKKPSLLEASWVASVAPTCLLASLAVTGACTPVMSVPPELVESSVRLDVTSESQLMSMKNLLTAGDYRLFVEATVQDEETPVNGGERTTRKSTLRIHLESARGDVRGTCVDEFSWTQIKDDLFARHVVDSMNCSGTTHAGAAWKLNVYPGDDNAYLGSLTINGENVAVRSLHSQALGGDGPLLGFALGDLGETTVAVQQLYNGKPGGLWLPQDGQPDPTSVAAMLALLLFSPGR